ncbi:hypothetical protein BZB76_1013 [Actinomadura pelletieri DSM 43383]|uniref:DUF4388 domain-containing protein n=1 Tax=Actinomadura pelletieri DSM 43383 TaxID=1120940 RepID=A0A495QZI3_9ACTN|nr:DUF4388 domain-containing protein [Actinomadura pelletieri]RKS79542.1 hypothetical protein BZB76_1013 [Actinomadura pelletieri DSM 43383]
MTDDIPGVLAALESERRTGLLRVGDDGAFRVENGAVVHAESRHAPGLDDLSGSDPSGSDLPALLAMFDAAYFLLGSTAGPVFTEGPPHGADQRISVATLVRERDRRRARLDAAWPDDRVDVEPVVPVRRVRRQRVILTGVQTEILINADGRRTPAELARHLGRTAFACLLAVRGLAAASLIHTVPRPASGPPPPRPAIPAEWAPPDHELLDRLRTALVELGPC